MQNRIDVNCDMGESFGAYKIGRDEEAVKYITTANIACGFHAGDPMVMEQTVKLATDHNILLGAHPGHNDLAGFGRRNIQLSPQEIKNEMIYQVGALMAFAKVHGKRVMHVKPHGAIGNKAMKDRETAVCICEAMYQLNPDFYMFGHANSVMLEVAKEFGFRTVSEIYADRAYGDDGMLAPRSMKGAVIHDKEFAIKRALKMVKEGVVETLSGKVIEIQAQSICVHGDTPEAIDFMKSIREVFTEEGIKVVGYSED